jgi:glycosyltransferase involved in cell wall biosynthesis
LFRQTFESIEFIFVNDASQDNSIELLEGVIATYPQRREQIRIIQHAANRGIGATRNTLLHEASGEYLMWVDSDDFLVPNAVELLYEKAEAKEADIITTDCYYTYRGEQHIEEIKSPCPNDPKEYIEALAFRKVRAALWGTLSKHSLWINHQIQTVEGMNYGEDYYTTVRLFYFANRLSVVHQPVYYYNQVNCGSYSSGRKNESHYLSIIALLNHLNAFFVQQRKEKEYAHFLACAKLTEIGALLLHSSNLLRQKYSNIISAGELNQYKEELTFSKWQQFLLLQIVSGVSIWTELLIFIAKVIRQALHIPF